MVLWISKLNAPLIVPLRVMLPEVHFTSEAAASVIGPGKLPAVAEEFNSTPPELMPVPEMVSGSAEAYAWPFKSKAAPLETTVAPATVPNAVVEPSLSVPAEIVAAPVYVFAPESVSTPAPNFSIVPVPEMTLLIVKSSVRLKIMVALLTTELPLMLPVVPAAPT